MLSYSGNSRVPGADWSPNGSHGTNRHPQYQNFELLSDSGRQQEFPVLFKRGFGITLNESLNAAEYLAGEGNSRVVFCLRGVRGPTWAIHIATWWTAMRQSSTVNPDAGLRRPVAFSRHPRTVARGHSGSNARRRPRGSFRSKHGAD